MKKFTFSVLLMAVSTGLTAQTPVLDSVEMGNGYANEVYYILEDGTKSPQAYADWHIGFSTAAQSATIFSNAKNTTVRLWPNGTNADFDTNIDITDIASWPALINDSVSFENGSYNSHSLGMTFNMGVPVSIDAGWGVYSFSDHVLRGDSLYLVTIGTDVYKVDFIKKETGSITLRYATVDNTTGGTEITIQAATYSKNFIFFNLVDGEIKDRELAGWDLWAIQYHDWYNGAAANQVVTGILTNPKWEVAKVNVGAGNQASHTDFSAGNFTDKKNELGQAYKHMNAQYQWVVTNSDVYYLRNDAGDVWKWYPTKFVGAGAGKTVFYKQKVATAGLTEEGTQFVEIFPNPAKDQLTIAFDSKGSSADIIVRNQMGQIVAFESLNTSIGITQQKLDISALANGVYYVEINQNGFATVKNVVKY